MLDLFTFLELLKNSIGYQNDLLNPNLSFSHKFQNKEFRMQDYRTIKDRIIKDGTIRDGTLNLIKDISYIYSDPISLKSTTFFANLTEILYTIFGDEKHSGFLFSIFLFFNK